MSERSEAIRNIQKASIRRENATKRWQLATADLHAACRQAHEEGEPITRIAQAAGVSRQAVYDLLGDRQPS